MKEFAIGHGHPNWPIDKKGRSLCLTLEILQRTVSRIDDDSQGRRKGFCLHFDCKWCETIRDQKHEMFESVIMNEKKQKKRM